MFVDTHAHLYKEYYDDIKDVVDTSFCDGIKIIISAGVDNKTNIETINLIDKFVNIYGAIGIHPEYANDYQEDDIKFIENNINKEKIVAVGEIGLDYHYEGYDKEKQIKLFEDQLLLAQKYNKPVIIHSRDATKDTIDILKKYHVKGVIHAFSGSKETALEYIKMGYNLGVGGVVTFKNSNLKDVYKVLGIENIVLETDSPYLSPLRGEKNHPGNIKYIVDFLSDYLNISREEISQKTSENVRKIFDIKC